MRYTDCTLAGNQERTVFSCDYNGWTDVPEEEREGIEAYESAHLKVTTPPIALEIRRPAPPMPVPPERRAA
jgi:hypothetical protein